jgi:hypothetical protein
VVLGVNSMGEVKLALLLEARAGIALTQGLEGDSVLGQVLRETLLCGNVLRAGRHRLPPPSPKVAC